MLRSFVQAKTEKNAQQRYLQQRRSRKRSWAVSRNECFQKCSTDTKREEAPSTADWMIKSNKKLKETATEFPQKAESTDAVHYPAKEESSVMPEQIFPQDQRQEQNLIIPPHSTMWYPPLYTSPYGIDPLHFFIDLRVSGHIYDRKIQKDALASSLDVEEQSRDKPPQNALTELKTESDKEIGFFRQSGHSSAFSVPSSNRKNMGAMNLCDSESKSSRFDVKSMGFDKSSNKTSSTYVMSNIESIYKNIVTTRNQEITFKEESENKEEPEESKERKDLRALIGLELVVDYMKQRPIKNQESDSQTSTDIESVGSPALEVVALQEDN